ncbi:methyltransferase domain-containing protein [Microtetraspora malaysiensis]|uniref:methyltransferase domain-containing protein n=1 Tax=Microtetraspora malaysiensis TaxID=161358 RepID=UPI003D8C56E1
MNWLPHAHALADRVTHPGSRWRDAIAETPRHLLVPAWWQWSSGQWELQYGPSHEQSWIEAAYRDRTLVTRVGGLHADYATAEAAPTGRPTSSSTLPSLIVQMFRHARVGEKDTVLDVGTGTGYGTALLCHYLGDERVTSIDVDPYLTQSAAYRLDGLGHRPNIVTGDGTKPLPGGFDRIVATVSVRPIPSSWLEALNLGGRLATTITNTSLIITATKTPDGGAAGQVERDWAMFMTTRTGADYPPGLADLVSIARTAEGDSVAVARFPVLELVESWEVRSMLEVNAPGIEHDFREAGETRIAVMVHEDGSWARAEQTGHGLPIVHQAGPRRLWDLLDEVRDHWLREGSLPLYGAAVRIDPDGTIHLRRGRWSATIG